MKRKAGFVTMDWIKLAHRKVQWDSCEHGNERRDTLNHKLKEKIR
jgi:hypothetical protein